MGGGGGVSRHVAAVSRLSPHPSARTPYTLSCAILRHINHSPIDPSLCQPLSALSKTGREYRYSRPAHQCYTKHSCNPSNIARNRQHTGAGVLEKSLEPSTDQRRKTLPGQALCTRQGAAQVERPRRRGSTQTSTSSATGSTSTSTTGTGSLPSCRSSRCAAFARARTARCSSACPISAPIRRR